MNLQSENRLYKLKFLLGILSHKFKHIQNKRRLPNTNYKTTYEPLKHDLNLVIHSNIDYIN